MTISERISAARRERRVLARVSRASTRVAAGAGRAGTDVGAGLGPRRGNLDPHPGPGDRAVTLPGAPARGRCQGLDARAAAGELRAAGWPAPEDPGSDEDTDLDGRDHLADRLSDEVDWLRQCADWLRQLDGGGYPPAVNLRPSADWPDRAVVTVDLARVAAGHRPHRRRHGRTRPGPAGRGPGHRGGAPDRRAERRRRLAEPDLEFRAFCVSAGQGYPTKISPGLPGPL